MSKGTLDISPLHDVMINCIFQDNRAAKALLSLVNSIRVDAGKEPIQEIVSVSSQYALIGESADSKMSRLDVVAKASDGRLINIEVQRSDDGDMEKRLAYYSDKLQQEDVKSGQKYAAVRPVSMIVIEDVGCPIRASYHESFSMRNDRPPHEPLLDGLFEQHIVSVPTYLKQHGISLSPDMDTLQMWLGLFGGGYKDKSYVEEATKMDVGINEFMERFGYASNDPDVVRKYDFWLSGKMEENRIRAHERAEGRVEGRVETRFDLFRGMYRKHAPQRIIRELAHEQGMSEREIREMFKRFQAESPAAPQVEAPKPPGMQM
jgi:predicted transposase/invertase (TIGR01784 family)